MNGDTFRFDGKTDGANGADGFNGANGGHGGNVVIKVTNAIVGLENLSIMSSGGDSGQGQLGGDGDEGRAGVDGDDGKADAPHKVGSTEFGLGKPGKAGGCGGMPGKTGAKYLN